ncbi:glucose sorbosone dehydrogenase [Cellulomonas flavigena DSM 20109]|uniref:Glucose sorbosone dehydrogenase n=1 Tax=Cellulomonas flavigena (strain ATCC 482 / DSM 20109 / BCRC 11376 / JCM 18109 / NBRC 3775 / NCIMB 8073 / NRS 134) TaxID=446466 RepID=D5UK13_CELFN|nr:PQQ-dependent sugar dehydrogenase [Cellulomonas flavigena]ADG73755.1 glucose sorbosone dehydrogenase [Cellulomonas flavigena DSM 20109]
MTSRTHRRRPGPLAVGVVGALLVGCTADVPAPGPSAPAPTTGPPATTSSGAPLVRDVPTVAVQSVQDVVTGLDVPWGLAFLPGDRALVTLRDAARLVVVADDGSLTEVTGPGAEQIAAATDARGEGGLLGVAVVPGAGSSGLVDVVVYLTSRTDNRVLRATLDGTTLGPTRVLLDGIPRGTNHNGGRLAFGPDGYLYVTTGDTYTTDLAPDPASLGGKVLRVTADGAPAPDNPDPSSPVWTRGHRNVQGIGWAPDGRVFASEFGQDTWDELNVLRGGADYGWPAVEGAGGAAEGYVDPVATWATSDASPSGLAVTDEGVYLAGLRGRTLWRVPLRPVEPDAGPEDDAAGVGTPQPLLAGEHGRLRAVEVAPDGSLWVLTQNTDGRGDPVEGDDRILRVTLG